MTFGAMRASPQNTLTRVLALTVDAALAQSAGAGLTRRDGFDLRIPDGLPGQALAEALRGGADVLLIDVDQPDILQSLTHSAESGRAVPVVAVTASFDAETARRLLRLRVSDFLLKPVSAADLTRACRQAAHGAAALPHRDARIYTFLPASGGVGVTTLAIESALLLTRSGRQNNGETCLVDLDFQHGACADYLDLEPRLDLDEIEPQPERLDAQLLEVMLSRHASGLSVICAPNRPADMRSFDPQVVTRLLDLVSERFDHVVLDVPRTWFAWTDNILLGSDHAFIVTEATVPGVRHAQALVEAIQQRLGEKARPRVIVNRFEQRLFAAGVKRADIQQALGPAFAGTIPNNYRLVREAIDRGVPLSEVKPRNEVTSELRKIITPSVRDQRSAFTAAGARIGLFQTT